MGSKSIIKTIIGSILFLILLAVLLTFLGKVFLPHDYRADQQQHRYYYFPKNTVDVLCDGNSTLRWGFSPNVLWHDQGIVAYSRTEGHQCPEMTYFDVKDTLLRHKVKLVIMSVPRLFSEFDYVKEEPMLRRSMDYKRLNSEKVKTAAAISSHTDILDTISYIFPLIRYHSRWADITYEDVQQSFERERDLWRGQLRVRKVTVFKPRSFSETSEEVPEYSKDAIQWYKKTIELCKENDINVLIVTMPELTHTRGMHQGIQEFADSYGVDYLDFNTDEMIETTGVKYEEDFYNKRHLNMIGARKVSEYLGTYIVREYDIPQWECSDDLKDMLDTDYAEYMKRYKTCVKLIQKKLQKK